MSNSYYTFTPRFVPGTKVRAQSVNNQFDLLEDAFDLLPTTPASIPLGKATLGTESGSGNAYVVTMPNTRLANANGDEVVFKATHQNSGASTLQIDSIAAVSLVRWDGTALSSGDILVDSYYVARYDSTNTRFLIVAPAQSTVVGAITYAAPSGKAKLAASAGTAATVIRSDADIAIDQTIVPTWSGQHTFSSPTLGPAGTALLPAWSFSGDPNTGSYSVGADDWGVATGGTLRFDISTTAITSTLSALGPAGSNTAPTWSFSGDPNTGAYSVGADDWGVTTGGTLRFDISTTAITSTLPLLSAAGSATAPTYSFSGDPNTGSYNVSADTWGVSTGGTLRFSVNGSGNGVFTGTVSGTNLSSSGGANPSASVGLSAVNGSAITFMRSDGAPALSQSIAPTWTGLHIFQGPGGTGAEKIRQLASTNNAATFMAWFNSDGVTRRGYIGIASGGIDFTWANEQSGGNISLLTTAGAVISGSPHWIQDGSVGAPGLAFNSNVNTGLYRSTADTLNIAAGGNLVAEFGSGSAGIRLGRNASAPWRIWTNSTTSVGLAGGASALPATPLGYWIVEINGTNCRIPFYNA